MPANFNPSPKQRFQEDDRRLKSHLALLERTDLAGSLDVALMQYQWELSENASTLNDAAANHFKISGALELLNIFKRLSQQHAPPPKKHDGSLIQT